MPRVTNIPAWGTLLFLFCINLVFPQSKQYLFDHITKSDGLSRSSTYSIIQDTKGFVWIGTSYGLNCYNGYDVIRFDRPKDPEQLLNSQVWCLHEDLDGNIWIGTSGTGLFVYNPESDEFRSYVRDQGDSLSISNNRILSIYQDKKGVIWIGTEEGGLNRFHKETQTFTAFRPVPVQENHKKNAISSMIEDKDGKFWIGTYEGLFHFNRTEEKFLPVKGKFDIPKIYQQILSLHLDRDETIWIGTLKGLFKYTKAGEELIHIISKGQNVNDHIGDDVILAIQGSQSVHADNLWLATRRGLINYHKNEDRFSRIIVDPTTPNTVSNNYLDDLFLNNNGILWIATRWSGVDKLDTRGNPFNYVQVVDALQEDYSQ